MRHQVGSHLQSPIANFFSIPVHLIIFPTITQVRFVVIKYDQSTLVKQSQALGAADYRAHAPSVIRASNQTPSETPHGTKAIHSNPLLAALSPFPAGHKNPFRSCRKCARTLLLPRMRASFGLPKLKKPRCHGPSCESTDNQRAPVSRPPRLPHRFLSSFAIRCCKIAPDSALP